VFLLSTRIQGITSFRCAALPWEITCIRIAWNFSCLTQAHIGMLMARDTRRRLGMLGDAAVAVVVVNISVFL